MQALAERLAEALVGRTIERVESLGFAGLATVVPPPSALVGAKVTEVVRRGKYLVVGTAGGVRLLLHLAQAGRVDLEEPPKSTRPRGAVVRITLSGDAGLLVREHGHERNARWWVLGPGEDGPLALLGPEADAPEFSALILESDDRRRIHTVLRDQRFAAGVGRGYADDALNRAGISPFTPLGSLDRDARARLVEAVRVTLAEALERERDRTGALSAARLGERFAVHNRSGLPCPRCATPLARVSYASYEIVYCPHCQTGGRVYADRRLSRLLR
jgi:formamidopyrimidine-DNA glycosylase